MTSPTFILLSKSFITRKHGNSICQPPSYWAKHNIKEAKWTLYFAKCFKDSTWAHFSLISHIYSPGKHTLSLHCMCLSLNLMPLHSTGGVRSGSTFLSLSNQRKPADTLIVSPLFQPFARHWEQSLPTLKGWNSKVFLTTLFFWGIFLHMGPNPIFGKLLNCLSKLKASCQWQVPGPRSSLLCTLAQSWDFCSKMSPNQNTFLHLDTK